MGETGTSWFSGIRLLDDLKSLGVKDLLDVYAGVNQAKIAQGTAESQNLIAKMRAQAELTAQNFQMEQLRALNMQNLTGSTSGRALMVGGAVLVVGLGLYLALRK